MRRRTSSDFVILLVCTGNVCRSALAERLGRSYLQGRLGEDAHRIHVASAGTRAVAGSGMQPDSALVLEGLGGDPSGFRARQFRESMAVRADLILTMTRGQRAEVLRTNPRVLPRTFTLREAADVLVRLDEEVEVRGVGFADHARSLVQAMATARGSRRGSDDDDIRDPMGMPIEVHQEVGEAIATALIPVLARLTAETPPGTRQGAHRAEGG